MLKIIQRKVKSFINMDKAAAFRYYKKRFLMHSGYFCLKIIGKDYFLAEVDGLKIKLGFSHPLQYWFAKKIKNHDHEDKLLLRWKKHAENSTGLILDCGGYSGLFGLVAGRANPEAQVYIFEPDKINYQNIQKNIALNGLKNVFAIEAAVSDRTGQINFGLERGSEAGKITAAGNLRVQSWALDDWLKDKGKAPSLIKIDVEGAELRVLAGAKNLLSQTGNLAILLEIHPKLIVSFNDSEAAIWQLLDGLGYKHEYLDKGGYNLHYWVNK